MALLPHSFLLSVHIFKEPALLETMTNLCCEEHSSFSSWYSAAVPYTVLIHLSAPGVILLNNFTSPLLLNRSPANNV